MLTADVPAEELPELRSWIMGPYDLRIGGGESSDDLSARVRSWLGGLPSSGRVAAFSHGGTIGTILHSFIGRPPLLPGESVGWSFRLGNTSISRVLISPSFVTLLNVNDTAHLDGLDPA